MTIALTNKTFAQDYDLRIASQAEPRTDKEASSKGTASSDTAYFSSDASGYSAEGGYTEDCTDDGHDDGEGGHHSDGDSSDGDSSDHHPHRHAHDDDDPDAHQGQNGHHHSRARILINSGIYLLPHIHGHDKDFKHVHEDKKGHHADADTRENRSLVDLFKRVVSTRYLDTLSRGCGAFGIAPEMQSKTTLAILAVQFAEKVAVKAMERVAQKLRSKTELIKVKVRIGDTIQFQTRRVVIFVYDHIVRKATLALLGIAGFQSKLHSIITRF